ncbi:MAG: helix-turn-helix domain-containing protein [Aeropyrum sp.]|nr:helix-turn-helix domain-containing protein [Aeropyrum sp.]MCE4615981.1 helix-turn-helix domain-containing protein [Aeropyrum sp.]
MAGLEDIITSKGKVKILKILVKDGQANITRLVRETGMHHKLVSKHIEDLKRMGLVGEKRYGRIRFIYLEYGDPRVRVIREIIKSLESM